MARSLKPQKVKEVKHRTLPMTLDILLDRNDLDFFFKMGVQIFRASDIDEVVKLAYEKLSSFTGVEWEQVIEIDHNTDDGQGYSYGKPREQHPRHAGMKLSFRRFERGRINGKWELERKHVLDLVDDSYAMKKREDNTAGEHYYERGETIIPYSEAAWVALGQMVQAVHNINDRLCSMLEHHDELPMLLARLAGRSVLALPEATRGKAKR